MLAGFTAAIVGIGASDTPEQVFDIAVARVSEISLRVGCAFFFSAIILPERLAAELLTVVQATRRGFGAYLHEIPLPNTERVPVHEARRGLIGGLLASDTIRGVVLFEKPPTAGYGAAVAALNATLAQAVVTAHTLDIQLRELCARLPAKRQIRVTADIVTVAPEVSGRVVELRVVENQDVDAGDVLFVIDPGQFESAVQDAEANLAHADAIRQLHQSEAKRRRNLPAGAVSAEDRQNAELNAEAAEAAYRQAEVVLARARLDLEWTTVQARGDCQEFRVRAMTMGRKEPTHGTPQSPAHPGRAAGPAPGRP